MDESRHQREDALRKLERDYGFQSGEFYLLEVIPLIAMMWVDGRNQDAEMRLLYKYVLNHVARLSLLADGEEVVSVAEVNRFLARFAHTQPSPDLLQTLRQLATAVVHGDDDWSLRPETRKNLIDYCLDIAAAAVHHYPFGDHDRLKQEEKALIHELMQAFCIAPTTRAA